MDRASEPEKKNRFLLAGSAAQGEGLVGSMTEGGFGCCMDRHWNDWHLGLYH